MVGRFLPVSSSEVLIRVSLTGIIATVAWRDADRIALPFDCRHLCYPSI